MGSHKKSLDDKSNKIVKKVKNKNVEVSWRKKHEKISAKKEESLLKMNQEFLEQKEEKKSLKTVNGIDTSKFLGKQYRPYNLTIAIPGSIMNNAQCPELMAYLASQVARAATLHCVDKVIIYDETSQMTDHQIKSYFSGDWTGEDYIKEDNVECNFHLARILEYLECPQYLRKTLFPMQKPLKFAGLMNPLDAKNHLRADDLSLPYREAVILKESKKEGKGELCNIGLEKKLRLDEKCYLPKNTRISVKLNNIDKPNDKYYKGNLTNPRTIRETDGLYWGYSVEIMKSLSEVLKNDYDNKIVVTENGERPQRARFTVTKQKTNNILVVFGGFNGITTALESDKMLASKNLGDLFDNCVTCLPDSGSNSIRTEEAILIALTELKNKFDRVL
ncbi:Putative RNA methyltransferase family and Nucleic acid-binding, OB-fold domain-containing protein [Strongyloides ratti]|uniref:Putative RNA methyltransferase family and Nucleic acid-binding, OB-fold domain-containing protein n=1 Tax=Strongyloides ratti TaxID=34506 RepID=A0A090LDY1_STRRB|nr:Putative RNA methyltransferase family and Nucleic acid-binding, OB-fold domain-containing protein [Strongyloides ratti]CEF67972.1 Putative RNA methyltransferase family and Nucleic acid-binding, OB-fold domain-containing protein [Strongyloides ratti]